VVHFVNPDLIATGLSPLRPELAAIAAGRLFLHEVDRLVRSRADFAFESTLSGLSYLNRLQRWKRAGYRIEIVYLRISSPRLALRRIAAWVKQGGHNVPRTDVIRRFTRAMKRKTTPKLQTSKEFSDAVGRALRRAAKVARKTARMHGTPIYIWKGGKVVAEKP